VHVETAEQEAATNKSGPPKSRLSLFGYRRGEKRYARRGWAVLLGTVVCVPTVALLVWWICR
jgi:hypothetical protein